MTIENTQENKGNSQGLPRAEAKTASLHNPTLFLPPPAPMLRSRATPPPGTVNPNFYISRTGDRIVNSGELNPADLANLGYARYERKL
jgi:hypothetical protein